VRISLGEVAGEAILRVDDAGTGIPADLRERVFERFARVDEARSDPRGTGLGLAIARELVVAHGGSITVDETHSPGTCFEVRLPI
jgi:signal transduction histidine kinase